MVDEGCTMRPGPLAAAATIGFVMLLAQSLAPEAAAVKRIGATPVTAAIRELGPPFARETLLVS
jgi:hypothetical protein